MEQAIWGENGLSRKVGMEGGGAGNLGWKQVKQGSGNGRRRSRQFGVDMG